MSDEIMNIEGRWKIWGGFLKLMSYSGIAVAIVTPADGPSFGIAPSGTWTWTSRFSK